MPIVAGVDFGTLSVRVTLVHSERGPIGTASAEYPLHRRREDPDFATQSHEDQMRALTRAMQAVLEQTGIAGEGVAALALDTTGSSVLVVDSAMQPLDDYYLWCDHRAHAEASEITAKAHALQIEAIDWCGGVYSHEWGFAKLLHWLRHNPGQREHFGTALEHCDMVAATLCGVTDPAQRQELVKGLYAVSGAYTADKNILLFDDLFRSGTTMNEITDVLLSDGRAKTVRAVTITKTRSNQ